ncbi:hypothetical protein E2C01_030726 [Portunus trituberculatus]|uniref:Uncharacterized protein n=1 Tax=Portunus trituberculatus TaxID=210409 RepID=A0A5B7ESP8_PORTR|nr:hypothetical protein [Portunus trituberculatus]
MNIQEVLQDEEEREKEDGEGKEKKDTGGNGIRKCGEDTKKNDKKIARREREGGKKQTKWRQNRGGDERRDKGFMWASHEEACGGLELWELWEGVGISGLRGITQSRFLKPSYSSTHHQLA